MEAKLGLTVHQSVPLRLERVSNPQRRKKGLLSALFASSLGKRGLCVVSTRGAVRSSAPFLSKGAAVLVRSVDANDTSEALAVACAQLRIDDSVPEPTLLHSSKRLVSSLVWFDEKVAPDSVVVDDETYRLLGAPSMEEAKKRPPMARLVYLDTLGEKPESSETLNNEFPPAACAMRCSLDDGTKSLLGRIQGPEIDAEEELYQHIRWSAAGRLLCVGACLVGVPFLGLRLNLWITDASLSTGISPSSLPAAAKEMRLGPRGSHVFVLGAQTRIVVRETSTHLTLSGSATGPHEQDGVPHKRVSESSSSDWDRAHANTISWDVVAGHSSAKTALLQVARETLNAQEICPSKSIQGVILSGPSGSGKSSLGRALAAKLQAHLEYVPCATLLGSSIRKLQHALGDVVEAAIMEAPSVLLFDDLDALLTDRIDTQTEEDSERVRAAMLTFFTKLSRRAAAVSHLNVSGIATVLVIATTRQRRIVDDVLGASGFFDREIALEMPNTAERLAVLETLVTATDLSSQSVLTTVAEQTRGFSPADLTALWRRATLAAYERQRIQSSVNETSSEPVLSQPELSCMDWREALAIVRPSSLPDWTLERPRARWSDIGGQEQAKRILMETLVLMQQHTAELERLGFRVPRGILLYGPPGCSKTLLARAAAAESGLLMLMVRGPELFNKYVGESEKAVQRVFQRARAAAPSLLFFDEIDALATNRSRTSSDGAAGAEERVLAQLLTELDGVEPLRDVVVVAATNRPDLLDAALLRPGRFDRLVYVGLPDTNERRNILRIHLQNVPLAASCSRDQTSVSPEAETLKDGLESACSSDSDFRETLYARLAAATQRYTGAEIAACVREACLLAMEQDPAGAAWVYPQHLEAALQRVRPRTDASLLRLYKEFGASLRTCP